jgi:hypothetical protein
MTTSSLPEKVNQRLSFSKEKVPLSQPIKKA